MGAADRFTFDEESHVYRLGDRVLPSVTQVIGFLTDLSRVPPDVLERKRLFGRAVHLACELDDAGELDESSTHPAVMTRVVAWRQALQALDARVVLAEGAMRGYHPRLMFAGTPDRLICVGGREHWLVDLKTSDDAYRSWGVQLAGYQLLLLEREDVPGIQKRVAVQLFDDGDFKVVPYRNPNDELCFRACLSIYQWKESMQ